jgi:circadian clock protein KaiC
MTQQVPELFGSVQLTGVGISSIADNLVLVRYVEVGGRLERALSVLKARGIRHETELRQLNIEADGVHVGPPFVDLRGVLTGIPEPVLPA